jgi:predicted nucleic acid-binding protein
MIVYLDSSALAKCYGNETGSLDTIGLLDGAEMVATSAITRVEVASALARAVRAGAMAPVEAREADRRFAEEFSALIRIPVTDRVLTRAQRFVWAARL